MSSLPVRLFFSTIQCMLRFMVQDRNSIRPGILAVISLGFVLTATFVFVLSKPKDTKEAGDEEVPALTASAKVSSGLVASPETELGRNPPSPVVVAPVFGSVEDERIGLLVASATNGNTTAIAELTELGAAGLMPLAHVSTNEHSGVRQSALNMIHFIFLQADDKFKHQKAEIQAELPNVLPWLEKALQDEDDSVKLRSLAALESLGGGAATSLPAIEALENHVRPEVRTEAKRAAARIRRSLTQGEP